MSGCCGQGPVIISGATATPRVDVEAVLLCDVLPDGTVTGLALVEPVYDTTSGARVGTRIVDPITGATYTPTGTLGLCTPPDACTKQVVERCGCDDTNGDGVADVSYTELWAVDPCGGAAPTLVGTYQDGDLTQPYTPVAPVDCTADTETQDTPVVLGTICYTDGAGDVRTAAVVKCAACGDPAVTYLDVETGATVTSPTVVSCAAPEQIALLLCDVATDGTATPFLRRYSTDGTNTTFEDTQLDGTTAYTPAGTVGVCQPEQCTGTFIGTLCYQEPVTQNPSFTLHKFADADPNHPGCLVGLDATDGDFPFIQYNDPITAWEGEYGSNTGTASNVEVSAPELGGFIDWSAFSPPIPSVPNAGLPAPYTGTAVLNGVTVTLEIFSASAITTGTQYLRMGGTEHFKLSFSSPVTMKFGTQGFADPAPGNDERFCNVTATGVVTGAGEIRTAYGLRDCKTGETTWRDQVSGDEVDLTQAVVVPCPQQQRDCASPTEPTATVGLCLADGTPIAVTVVRDCAGTVTSEGWLNLTTGAYSAGAPPAGTVACGDSRSIQVSGMFCDIDPVTGDVLGLVLIEYTYDDTGAIASVRLVDATTGGTYTPTGTVTTCPAGVEQPEQDVVILCDVQANGTSVPLVRDYRRDETGAIVGHSDYTLDGAPYMPTGTVGQCTPDAPVDVETYPLCVLSATGAVLQRVRREVVYDAAGAAVSSRLVDAVTGAAVTVPAGASVGVCPSCRDCETLLLCDDGADDPATLTGLVSSGNLSNGVAWTAKAPNAAPAKVSNADGSWWGQGIFPNPVLANTTWTFDRPVDVEFSVELHYFNYTDPTMRNAAQLPVGAVPVSLPAGYSYDATTSVVTVDSTVTDCTALTNPRQATSARFKLPNPVTTFSLQYLGARVAACGVFDMWRFGSITVTPSGQFLRTVCRDCSGAVISTTDTRLDAVTPYTPLGAVGQCVPPAEDPEQRYDVEPLILCDTATDGTVRQFLRHYVYDDLTGAQSTHRDTDLDGSTPYVPSTGGTVGQCQPAACELTPICVRPSGRVEFLSNPAGDTSGVDADWTWGQSLAGPWFPTYRVGVYPGWTTVDPGTAEGTAHWIAPHPDSQLANTGQPGEGPAITAGTPDWYGRASFALPSFADPATIRISATALNADQLAVEWRLNGGAWQPVNSNHTQPPYTLPPTAVPGAQAGVNEIVVHVKETVFPTGAAGILLHVIAEYDVDATAYLPWTQVVCTDGSVYFLDELGARQDALPDGATIVPCPDSAESCAKTVIERCGCDDTDGDGIGDVQYTELWAVDPCNGGAPELLGTYLDGDLTQPYTPVAPVECTAADLLPGPLSTGVRALTGTAAQDIAGSFPGLQSVSLTVLAGAVNVTMSDGAAVPIPAGVTMTWSVAQDSDTALAVASFAGATAAASYLLNWTYR